MDSLQIEELRLEVDDGAGPLRVLFSGRSTHRDPGQHLHPFFESLFERARKSNRPVSMHFEKLTQFNSSTIAALIQLIHRAQHSGVGLLIHYDDRLKWQALSFEALRRAIEPFQQVTSGRVQFVPVGGR